MKLKILLLPFVFGSETDVGPLPELSSAPASATGTTSTPTTTTTTTTTTEELSGPTVDYPGTMPGPEYPELPVPEECIWSESWTAKYTVTISTANKFFAGTDDTVYIDIIGTDGQTGMVRLNNEDEDDFEMGRDSIFEIEHEYKGSLEQIQFIKGGCDRWQVEKATISFINNDTTESFEFDCQDSKMEHSSAICKLVPT